MRVLGIHRLTLAAPALFELGTFYRDVWGMTLLERSETRWNLRCRASSQCDFALERRDGKAGLAALALRVPGKDALEALIAAAQGAGGRLLRALSPSNDYPGERSAALADPDGNAIELVIFPRAADRQEHLHGQFGPHRIGHVVLWTPHIEAAEAFYGALGLRVTDRTAMGMSFLRCNADHHSLALVKSEGQIGLQHIAFDVGTFDAVMREYGRLKAASVECVWGPGRHGPGANVFSYYRDPAGTIIEFYGEMQQFFGDEEAAEPVWWGPEHRGDVWGIAGPAPQAFRP